MSAVAALAPGARAASAPGRVVFPVPSAARVMFGESPSDGGILTALTRPDGALIAAGLTQAGDHFAVAQLRPDGTLDSGFGAGGVAMPAAGAASGMTPTGIMSGADGKLLITGDTANAIAVVRLDAAGQLDPAFGSSGAAITAGSGGSASALLPDGRILVAGSSKTGAHQAFVERLTTAGALDPGYGVGGVATLPGSGSGPVDLALMADGSLVVLYSNGGTGAGFHTMLDGLTADGSPNPGFAGGAPQAVSIDGSQLLAQPDGSLLLLSRSGELARYTPAGAPDTAYGVGGRAQATAGATSYKLIAGPQGGTTVVGIASMPCNHVGVSQFDSTGRPAAPASVSAGLGGGSFVSFGAGSASQSLVDLNCGALGVSRFAVSSRPGGGFFLGTGVGVDEAQGEGAVNTSYVQDWAVAAFTQSAPNPALQLDPAFGAASAPRVRVRIPRQPPARRSRAIRLKLSSTSVPGLATVRVRAGGALVASGTTAFFTAANRTASFPLTGRGRRLATRGGHPRISIRVDVADLAGNRSHRQMRGRLP